MKSISKETARYIWLLLFSARLPVWIFNGLACGIALGLWQKSWPMFWFGLIVAPLGLSYWSASKRVSKLNNAYQAMATKIKSALIRSDYFNTGEFGAIAVDAENRQIATVSANQKFVMGEPVSFSADKIRNYKAFAPGYNEWDSLGHRNALQASEMLQKNINNRAQAHAKSGLYFDLDDVMMPQVFVQMEYSEAEKWLLIIEKLLNGSLETRSEPMLFPQA